MLCQMCAALVVDVDVEESYVLIHERLWYNPRYPYLLHCRGRIECPLAQSVYDTRVLAG
jgi:hypothetical protein